MSNRLLTSAIDVGRKLPVTKGRLDFLQDNVETLASSIMLGLLGTYTTNDVIIVQGCVFTGTDPGARTMTSGIIYYNGLFYQVPAASFTTGGSNMPLFTLATLLQDQATFSDGFNTLPAAYVERIQTFVLVAGPAGGSGVSGYIADYNSSTVKPLKGLWANVSALNSWSNITPLGSGKARYKKGITEEVVLQGFISANGGSPTSSTIFTLPLGYRPSNIKQFIVYGSNGTGVGEFLLRIQTSGDVQFLNTDATTPTYGITSFIYLDTARFYTDN